MADELLPRRRTDAKPRNVIDGTIERSAQPMAAGKVNNQCEPRSRVAVEPTGVAQSLKAIIEKCCCLDTRARQKTEPAYQALALHVRPSLALWLCNRLAIAQVPLGESLDRFPNA